MPRKKGFSSADALRKEMRHEDPDFDARHAVWVEDPSVFDIQNRMHDNWFLSRDHIIANVVSAQCDPTTGSFVWVEFTPLFHSYLLRSVL